MSFNVKGLPFNYKGVVDVSDCETAADVIKKARLNWEVGKCNIVGKMPAHINEDLNADAFLYGGEVYRTFENSYATYRKDLNIPLGIVKGKYTPVQNIEAFNFFNDAIGVDKAIWQTAGIFGNGERIFVSAKLPDTILVNGDPVDNYLVFTNSHDGSSGVKILFTPIRIVCENTLTAAINTSSNFITFRHTKSVHSKINIAKEILGICKQKSEHINECYNLLAKKSISDNNYIEWLCSNILTDKEYQDVIDSGYTFEALVNKNWRAIDASGVSMRKVNILNKTFNYYYEGPGQKEFVGTLWGAVNSITGYYSNIDNSEGINRMDSILYGDKSRKIINSFDSAMKLAQAA